MSKHTAGPWELSEGNTSVWAVSPLHARIRIANIIKHASANGIDHNANACLIAAAPDLFQNLKGLLAWIEATKKTPGCAMFMPDKKYLETAYAAIAKAEGSAP